MVCKSAGGTVRTSRRRRILTDSLFFAVKTIGLSTRGGRKPSTLLVAARHNLRESQRERGARANIDPSRSDSNRILSGPLTAREVVGVANAQAAAAGVDVVALRKDHCQAVELLFSLSAGSDAAGAIVYFDACLSWAEGKFGVPGILSAVVHFDESAPHLHVLVSPLVEGRMNGSALVARERLIQLRSDFFAEVGRRYGICQPQRLAGSTKGRAIAAVLDHLNARQDPILRSVLLPVVRAAIDLDPTPFLAALGLRTPNARPKRQRTMTEIFTSTGEGPRVEPDAHMKPIGFSSRRASVGDSLEAERNGQNLSCVGFGQETESGDAHGPGAVESGQALVSNQVSTESTPDAAELAVAQVALGARARTCQARHAAEAERPDLVSECNDSVLRLRKSKCTATSWCEERGELVDPPPQPGRLAKAAAKLWASTQLARFSRSLARFHHGDVTPPLTARTADKAANTTFQARYW